MNFLYPTSFVCRFHIIYFSCPSFISSTLDVTCRNPLHIFNCQYIIFNICLLRNRCRSHPAFSFYISKKLSSFIFLQHLAFSLNLLCIKFLNRMLELFVCTDRSFFFSINFVSFLWFGCRSMLAIAMCIPLLS